MASRPQRAPGRGGVAALVALLACAGCATAPKYVAPSVEAGDAFKELGPWQPAGVDVPLAGPWWELFGDPVLSGLAGRIEAANPALAASVARYAQATALVGRARGELAPQVDVSGSAEATRLSAGRPLSPGTSASYRDYAFGASLGWELDLFGRVRNSVNVAEANSSMKSTRRIELRTVRAAPVFGGSKLDHCLPSSIIDRGPGLLHGLRAGGHGLLLQQHEPLLLHGRVAAHVPGGLATRPPGCPRPT